MVQRNSEALRLQQQDASARIDQPGVGNASVQVQRAGNTLAPAQNSDRVLQSIIGDFQELAQAGIKTTREEAYLQGMSKAGQIKSEEELEGNPITRDWAVAGYRDTMGRLALASKEAELAKDMLTLREQSPEKMQEYLAKRRAELTPTMQGMSRAQRESQFGQLLVNDQAAIATHTTEHTKFIIETEQKSFNANYSVRMAALQKATLSGSIEQQNAEIQASMASIYGMVLNNPKLPESVQQGMIGEAAEFALANNQVGLFDQIRNAEIVIPSTGKTQSMFSLLSEKEQIKLSNQYRETKGRTKAMWSAQYGDALGKYKAVLSDPSADLPDQAELMKFLDHGTRTEMLSEGARTSMVEDYWKAAARRGNDGALSTALSNGDRESIFKQGKSEKDALNAWTRVQIKGGADRGTVIEGLGTLGASGFGEAFTQMGEMTKGDVQSMLNTDGTVNEQSATVVHNILVELGKLEASGKDGSFTAYLKAFDPEAQATLGYMREAQRAGMGPDAAVQFASKRGTEDKKYTPAQRNAISETNAKDDAALIQTIGETQFFKYGWDKAKGFVGLGDGSSELNTYRNYWENPQRVADSVEQTRAAVLEEMGHIGKVNPMMTAETRFTQAVATVQNRTVTTSGGNLVIPRGTNIHKYFGVPQSAGNEDIGKALSTMVKPSQDSGRIQFVAHEGRISYTEYNKDGVRAKTAVIDPRDVAKHLQDVWQGDAVTADKISGSGVTKKVGNLDIQYNGQNTAAVDDALVYKFRSNLIKHEGVRDVPYKDLSGKLVDGKPVMTVGVGVSSHNPHYPKVGADGKVSSADASAAFRGASNDAAVAGANLQRSTGIKGDSAFLLFSELAYQSGTAFHKLPKYQEMLLAIKSGDVDVAVKALHGTPAWKHSGSSLMINATPRQKEYESLLRKTMKG